MKRLLINLLKFSLFLGLGLGILYLVYRSQNKSYQAECALRGIPAEECSLLDKVIYDFSQVNYWWILVVLIAFILSNVSRALRWNMLIRPMGFQPRTINAFLTIVIGYFANLGLPRMGEVVRAGTMSQYERIPLEKAMGTIVVGRIADVIMILLLSTSVILLQYDILWGFLSENVNLLDKFSSNGLLLALILGTGLLGLLCIWIFRAQLLRFAVVQKIVAIGRGFWEGIQTIGKLDKPWLFLFHTLFIWCMYFFMTYLCFFSFAPTAHLGPLVGLVVFVFGGWGIVIPSPGGMGTYHFLVQTALSMYGISGDDGFSFANIAFFSISLGVNVLLGIIGLIALPLVNRHYSPQSTPAAA